MYEFDGSDGNISIYSNIVAAHDDEIGQDSLVSRRTG